MIKQPSEHCSIELEELGENNEDLEIITMANDNDYASSLNDNADGTDDFRT